MSERPKEATNPNLEKGESSRITIRGVVRHKPTPDFDHGDTPFAWFKISVEEKIVPSTFDIVVRGYHQVVEAVSNLEVGDIVEIEGENKFRTRTGANGRQHDVRYVYARQIRVLR